MMLNISHIVKQIFQLSGVCCHISLQERADTGNIEQ